MKGAVFICFVFFILSFLTDDVYACTVWAAVGSKTEFKGTLVAKNRDNLPHLVTEVKFQSHSEGFKILGLYDIEEKGYIVAGINEKGLAVLNSSAMSVPRHIRNVAKEDFSERLLKYYDSVESVLKDIDVFTTSHPALYMLADKNSVATVEVGPKGKVATKIINDGTAAITNHYTDNSLIQENINNASGSKIRLKRIEHLLNSTKRPFNMEDFIAVSNDRKDGPDFGIYRTGSTKDKIRTLACIVIAIPALGEPQVYIKISNPGGKERLIKGKIDFLNELIARE